MTHAEAIASELKGKYCEIFLGEHVGKTIYSDYEIEQMGLVRGTVVKANGEMLVVDADVMYNKTKRIKRIFINGWVIKAISEHEPEVNLLKALQNDEQKKPQR